MRQSVSIVVGPRERRAPLADLVRSHAEAFLDPPGCPVCEYCVEAEEQFFRWFEIESFADPEMHARLRRSVGFCPRHERRALRVRQLAPIPAIVRGALEQLGSAPPERGECPACASVRQAREQSEGMLHTVLGSPDLSARYAERDVGRCVPDVAVAIVNGDHEIARALAEKLRRDLMTGHAFELVAGRDLDAPVRAAARAALPAGVLTDWSTSAEDERATWQLEACPVCHRGWSRRTPVSGLAPPRGARRRGRPAPGARAAVPRTTCTISPRSIQRPASARPRASARVGCTKSAAC